MSGKGNCYDNSAVESFFKPLKAQMVWRRNWKTRREVEGNATRALNAASWFLRFDISVLLVLGDQQTSDRSFRHCPIFGG